MKSHNKNELKKAEIYAHILKAKQELAAATKIADSHGLSFLWDLGVNGFGGIYKGKGCKSEVFDDDDDTTTSGKWISSSEGC